MLTGKYVAIKKIDNVSETKYTTVKALRELSLLDSLQQQQDRIDLPPLFAGLIDAFAPEAEISNNEIRTLFIVMNFKQRNL